MITKFYEFRHSPDNMIYISKYFFEFIGTGLNDASINGYLGNSLNFLIEIDSTGATDTFKWSSNGGATWNAANVVITGGNQLLANNVSIRFSAITGHLLGDKWTLTGSLSEFPLYWFILAEPTYSLPINPPNLVWQWYKPEEFHNVYDGVNEFYLGVPWLDGDIYISKQSIYDVAYAEYINVPPTLSDAKKIKISQLNDYKASKRSGGIVYSGNTFNSSIVDLDRMKSELDYSLSPTGGGGVVPLGYYVKNIVGTHISLSVSDLQIIIPKIEELHYLCRIPYDTHYENINALTTVEDVELYDFTTSPSFPIVPYNP